MCGWWIWRFAATEGNPVIHGVARAAGAAGAATAAATADSSWRAVRLAVCRCSSDGEGRGWMGRSDLEQQGHGRGRRR